MSIFPAKILVATDGSEEADLALQTATDLARYTGSELHLVYVEAASYVSPTTEWETFDGEDLPNWLEEATMEAAKTEVDRQVQRVRGEGGEVAGAHAILMIGERVLTLIAPRRHSLLWAFGWL